MHVLIKETTFDTGRMRQDATRGNANATDIADWLVTDRGLTFREAHHKVGALIRALDDLDLDLVTAPAQRLGELDDCFVGMPAHVTTLEHALDRRTSFGGTAPINVQAQAAALAAANESLSPD